MSALNRFSLAQLDALKRGRAIPFLVEYRDAAFSNHTLSVIGLIDDGSFVGLFLPEDKPDCKLISLPIEGVLLPEPYPVECDSADAMAIHRLWSDWDGGVRQMYIDLFRDIGRAVAQTRVIEALDAMRGAPSMDAPPRKSGRPGKPKPDGARRRKEPRK